MFSLVEEILVILTSKGGSRMMQRSQLFYDLLNRVYHHYDHVTMLVAAPATFLSTHTQLEERGWGRDYCYAAMKLPSSHCGSSPLHAPVAVQILLSFPTKI